eukprot:m.66945 g.66945  ORF g.66945 m.66945 type:complete len:264 (-) comp23745_c0_seq5:41-832(-)
MPKKGVFSVELVVNGNVLKEVTDTNTDRCYAVATAGDEYKIRLSADGKAVYGAILQIDGSPEEKDFLKSPFTYFRNPYDDPGFWTKPSEGKYAPRKFTQPQTELNAEEAHMNATNLVGRIRVYFFTCAPKAEGSSGRVYSAPKQTTIAETKKWYVSSNVTRYGASKSSGTTGGGYRIVDRSVHLQMIEMWYKDVPSLELLGWDKTADSFAFEMPWEKQQRLKEENKHKKRKVEAVIDLTQDADTDDEDNPPAEQQTTTPLVIE